jgi:hypothetical protein
MSESNFNSVQEAARRRAANTMSSETLARQIVAAAQGDARLAYEFMDVLNKHVTRMLQEKKHGYDRSKRCEMLELASLSD